MDKTASLDSIPTGLLADPQPYPIYCCIQQWGFGDSISLLGKGESEGDEGEVEGKKEGEAEDAAPACVPLLLSVAVRSVAVSSPYSPELMAH